MDDVIDEQQWLAAPLGAEAASGHYSESRFWETLRSASRATGAAALRPALELYFVMTAAETPLWAKATVVGALGYLILPLDVIPDWLPGIGWGDDISVMLGALRTVTKHNTPAIQDKARTTAERFMASVVRPRRSLGSGTHFPG